MLHIVCIFFFFFCNAVLLCEVQMGLIHKWAGFTNACSWALEGLEDKHVVGLRR
ncbi:hypothetical protein HanPI659440_Chr01g0021791 [Helianthus annuus]|nr:hypothetical protein HanPI659440_Chr01g0021791 [Helianthus annuus]